VLSVSTLVLLSWVATLLVAIGAIGSKIFDDYSRSELKQYCRQHGNVEFFNLVRDRYQNISLASETLVAIAGSVAVVSLALTVITDSATGVGQSQRGMIQGLLEVGMPDGKGEFVSSQVWTSVVTIAISLLLLGVWLPRALVSVWSSHIIYHTWAFWLAITWLMTPLTLGVRLVGGLAWRLSGRERKNDDEEALEDEIRSIVTAGMRDGLLEEDEWDMIEGVMELDNVDVRDIMTPRNEIDALQLDSDWSDVLELFERVRRTRIPVYDQSLDNCVGILYVKDLLTVFAKPGVAEITTVQELLRPAEFVPASKAVDALLRGFQKDRIHLALVVDEFNAVVGLVTIEDALEEIVGEIIDEDDDLPEEIFVLPDRCFEALGKAHIDAINGMLGMQLPESDEVDTVAGLVIHQLGYIPEVGQQIEIAGTYITVIQATKRRIERVRLKMVNEA
jgi:CBS domain containing-hemolysin-like protein